MRTLPVADDIGSGDVFRLTKSFPRRTSQMDSCEPASEPPRFLNLYLFADENLWRTKKQLSSVILPSIPAYVGRFVQYMKAYLDYALRWERLHAQSE